MSHQNVTLSPPGTPTADCTVGELVAEAPGLSRVFQRYQLDFCCQGAKTLREACRNKGLALEEVVEALAAELEASSAAERVGRPHRGDAPRIPAVRIAAPPRNGEASGPSSRRAYPFFDRSVRGFRRIVCRTR